MKTYTHVISKIFGRPLMVTPPRAAQIVAALEQRFAQGSMPQPHASPDLPRGARIAGWDMDKGYAVYGSGIAVIGIEGTLVHKSMSAYPPSGFLTYPEIETQIVDAATDPRIRAIALDIDSPGGEATDSVFQLADAIRVAATLKPVWAIADEQMTSAAYLLACGASRIFMPPMGCIGSIGVIALHLDQSAHDANEGLKYTIIKAGARKAEGNPFEPASEQYLASVQASVDALYDRFVATVSANRGITEAAVRGTEAGVFEDASAALEIGLIDEIATPAEMLNLLENSLDRPSLGIPRRAAALALKSADAAASTAALSQMAAAAAPKEMIMSDTPAAAAAPTPKKAEDGSTCAECGKALAPAASAQALDAARTEGATAERTRILGIEAAAMPGHENLIAEMKADGKTTPGEAALKIVAAERAKGGAALAALKGDDASLATAAPPAPVATAPGSAAALPADAPLEDRCKVTWGKDGKLRAEFGGSFDHYLAFAKAEASGKVKILRRV